MSSGGLISYGDTAERLGIPQWIQIYVMQPSTAVRSITLAVGQLARNAVITKLDVKLTAKPADFTPLSVAQVRAIDIKGNLTRVVIDFATLVTISGVTTRAVDVGIWKAWAWNGSSFGTSPFYQCNVQSSIPDDGNWLPSNLVPQLPSGGVATIFPSEVRTEKLQLEIVSALSNDAALAQLQLHLPDAPSGLELVTDSGLRLFTQAATVTPAAVTPINDHEWNSAYQRVVHLAPLLAPLAGDPLDRSDLPLTLTFSSRVPGVLKVEEVARDVAWLERLGLGPDGQRELVFEAEGVARFELMLASIYTHARSARFTALGKPGPERVLPPIGPTPIPDLDLMITPALAMVCRVPVAGLETLTGVRLAFAAGEEGAEAKVVALAAGPGSNDEPGAAIERAASRPITLPAGGQAVDAPWTTFAFDQPIALKDQPYQWIAILVSRGRLAWSMGQYPSASAAVSVRRGPPGGPWVRLPSMFQNPSGFRDLRGLPLDLRRLGARVRAVGIPPANAPIAPFRFELTAPTAAELTETGGLAVTPTAKGAVLEWTAAEPLPVASSVQVQVVSYAADTLTLRDLDVTLTK